MSGTEESIEYLWAALKASVQSKRSCKAVRSVNSVDSVRATDPCLAVKDSNVNAAADLDKDALLSESRRVRLSAVRQLQKDLAHIDVSHQGSLEAWLSSQNHSHLCLSMSDPADQIREATITLLIEIFAKFQSCMTQDASNSSDKDSLTESILEEICCRRFGKQLPVAETSEEVRLKLVSLTDAILKAAPHSATSYKAELLCHLHRALVDPHPEIKKAGCTALQTFVSTFNKGSPTIDTQCPGEEILNESMIEALITNMSHQHFRVRNAAISAARDFILFIFQKDMKSISAKLEDRLFDGFLQLIHDRVVSVQKTMYTTVIMWVKDPSVGEGFKTRFIPVLLIGCVNDCQEIRDQARREIHDYAANSQTSINMKNESNADVDFKESMTLTIVSNVQTLSCCWNADNRLSGMSLLVSFLSLNYGALPIQHTETILDALVTALADEEEAIADRALEAVWILGARTSEECLLKYLAGAFTKRKNMTTATQKAVLLLMASNMMQAAVEQRTQQFPSRQESGEENKSVEENIRWFVDCVSAPAIAYSSDPMVRHQFMETIHSFIKLTEKNCSAVAQDLCVLLLSQQGLDIRVPKQLKERRTKSSSDIRTALYTAGLDALANVMDVKDATELTDLFGAAILSDMSQQSEEWNRDTKEVSQFCALMCSCSSTGFASLFENVNAVIASCLADHRRDAELRLHFLFLIRDLLNSGPLATADDSILFAVVTEWIMPSMIWRAGRTAACIRHVALSVLKMLLDDGRLSCNAWIQCIQQHALLPSLYQALDEDYFAETRITALKSLEILVEMTGPSLDGSIIESLHPELLKRLEDSQDAVRMTAFHVLASIINHTPAEAFQASLHLIHEKFGIHLRDSNPEIQQAAKAALSATAT